MFFSAFQQGQYAEPANGYILIYDQGLSESDIKLLIKFFWWHQNSFEMSRNSVRACDPNLIPVSKLPYNQRAGMMPRFCQNSLNKTSNWADRFFFSVRCQHLLCVSRAWRCAASKALKSLQIDQPLHWDCQLIVFRALFKLSKAKGHSSQSVSYLVEISSDIFISMQTGENFSISHRQPAPFFHSESNPTKYFSNSHLLYPRPLMFP